MGYGFFMKNPILSVEPNFGTPDWFTPQGELKLIPERADGWVCVGDAVIMQYDFENPARLLVGRVTKALNKFPNGWEITAERMSPTTFQMESYTGTKEDFVVMYSLEGLKVLANALEAHEKAKYVPAQERVKELERQLEEARSQVDLYKHLVVNPKYSIHGLINTLKTLQS